MELLGIFIAILIGLNLIPLVVKKNYPRFRKSIRIVLIISIVVLVFELVASSMDLKIKGTNTIKIIAGISLISSILYLVLQNTSKSKIIANLILIPTLLISVNHLLVYDRIGIHKLNDELNLVVSSEGFLGCGENIRITKDKFGIFDNQLKLESNLCLIGITKIEPILINNQTIEIMIHHNGERDSENPYHYKIENKNEW